MALILLVGIGMFSGFFLHLKIKIGRRRKKLYRKFHALSDTEKMEVNTDLSQKFKFYLAGVNRFYFKAHLFMHFVDYRDIAWVYLRNTAISMVGEDGTIGVMNNTTMMLWDRDGVSYQIPMADPGTIETIRHLAPDVIAGFSKERLRLAKRDFEGFLLEN